MFVHSFKVEVPPVSLFKTDQHLQAKGWYGFNATATASVSLETKTRICEFVRNQVVVKDEPEIVIRPNVQEYRVGSRMKVIILMRMVKMAERTTIWMHD